MVRDRDFAALYAGRAVFGRNGGSAGSAAGRNDMHGAIPGDGSENVSSKIQKAWKH